MGDDVWRHRSGPLQGLSFAFAVRCDDEELGHHIDALLRSLQGSRSASVHWYSLVTADNGHIHLYRDDHPIAQLSTAGRAIEWLIWDVNRSSAESSNEYLLFHAGGVQVGNRAVLFPAPSGRGKSTLVAGLVQRGLGYLSDELIAVSTDGTRVQPYPKPITLKPGSFDLFPDLVPDPGVPDRFAGEERYLRPGDVRAGAVGRPCDAKLLVVPRYVPDVVTGLTPLTATDAFLALTINSVNLDHHGEQGAQGLANLVARCDAYELVMSDHAVACNLVLEALGEGRSGRG
jgi:hypothetical protein